MSKEPKLKETRWNIYNEKEIQKKWAAENIYKFDAKSNKKIFSIDTPPPYPRPN